MRYFFTKRLPRLSRILMVESGSRYLLENLLPFLRYTYGEQIPVDLVTCFAGLPAGLQSETTHAYCVSDYRGIAARWRLCRELVASRYAVLVIICSGESIMAKWKWVLAACLPAKVLVLNENGDCFWLDYGHWRTIRHFVLFRSGLSGADAVRTLGRLALFPFTFLYLLLYAAVIHLRRKVHG